MVVHTPSKLDVLRQTAAERRAADAGVPPSVAAAAAAAAATSPDATSPPVQTTDAGGATAGDLLGGLATVGAEVHHDFDAWDGNTPPALEPNAGLQPGTRKEGRSTRQCYNQE